METTCGIIFDVDGVIADTEGANARASTKVFSDMFGVEGVKREDFEEGIGRGAAEYIRAAARVHGLSLSDKQVEEATRARQENFLRILEKEPLEPFPGVSEIISAALARNYITVAIATSSNRDKSTAVLESAGIPYKKLIYVTGDDVTRKKPDPELFLTAARRMGVPPKYCVVIEDSPDGVKAALSAGCKCIAVTNTAAAGRLSGAHLVVSSLSRVSVERIIELIPGGD